MRLTKMGIARNKIANNNDELFAQEILLKTGQLFQFCSGVYGYDNVLHLLMQNVKAVIEKHLNKIECVEISLPVLQPTSIWEESGRLQKYVDEDVMFLTKADNLNFCLAPTAEEAVVVFGRSRLSTYKQLPVTFYQIGTKFRNEIRTKGYLIRGRAFEMMDAYSFGRNYNDLDEEYARIKRAYYDIFAELKLDAMAVGADTGAMGGKKSEEFMLVSDLGEDTIFVDKENKKAFNSELLERPDAKQYLKEFYGIDDIDKLEKCRSLELGHIFQLGTRYSDSMNATFVDENGKSQPYCMGCYGIGVSRLVAVIYEKNAIYNDKGEVKGFSLPFNIAPYKAQIIYSNTEEKQAQAVTLYNELMENGVNCLLDDRQDIMFGAKIKDANFLGTPYLIVLGNKTEDGKVEVENTKTGDKKFMTNEQVMDFFKNLK